MEVIFQRRQGGKSSSGTKEEFELSFCKQENCLIQLWRAMLRLLPSIMEHDTEQGRDHIS